jgi:hypothetical protein
MLGVDSNVTCFGLLHKIKCMTRSLLILEKFLRSHLLLLRLVLVFLPMEPRWLRPGAPLVGPICNLGRSDSALMRPFGSW